VIERVTNGDGVAFRDERLGRLLSRTEQGTGCDAEDDHGDRHDGEDLGP